MHRLPNFPHLMIQPHHVHRCLERLLTGNKTYNKIRSFSLEYVKNAYLVKYFMKSLRDCIAYPAIFVYLCQLLDIHFSQKRLLMAIKIIQKN